MQLAKRKRGRPRGSVYTRRMAMRVSERLYQDLKEYCNKKQVSANATIRAGIEKIIYNNEGRLNI